MAKQQFDVAMLKKHHFWIVAGLLILVAPVMWMMSTGSLADAFTQGKSARESARNSINSFAANQQPNESINRDLQARHDQLKLRVLELWQARHGAQDEIMYFDPDIKLEKGEGAEKQSEPLFSPPFLEILRENSKDAKGDVAAVETARTTGKEVRREVRAYYAMWLRRHKQFNRLYDLIGLREQIVVVVKAPKEKKADRGRDGGRGNQDAEEKTEWSGRVAWSKDERSYYEAKFGQGGAWLAAPSTEQMVYTQESLNVLAVVLKYAIAETNGQEQEHQLLPIKKIDTIRIGEDCGQPVKPGAVAAGGMPSGGGGGMPGGGGGGMPGGGGVGGGGGGQQNPDDAFAVGPLSGGGGAGKGAGGGGAGGLPPDGRMRYVDDDGYAIADQPYAEFRMLPITMRLVMDGRYLPVLLDNCLFAPLPIVVTQWNLRSVTETGGRRGGAQGGGMLGGGAMGGGAMGGGAMGGGAMGGGAMGGGAQPNAAGNKPVQFGVEVELGPYDREVEIKGIIYIYNPPDLQKVGSGTVAKAAQEPPPSGDAPKAEVGPKAVAKPENGGVPEKKASPAKAGAPEKAGTPEKGTPEKGAAKNGAAKKGDAAEDTAPKAPAKGSPAAKEPAAVNPPKN